MTLRDTNPERLEQLMKEIQKGWEDKSEEEHLEETWKSFLRLYFSLAEIAWEIEASQGHLSDKSKEPPGYSNTQKAEIRDLIASGALRQSAEIADAIDKLEAQKEIVAWENLGEKDEFKRKTSDMLITMINCVRPIADVIQDAAANVKSESMTTLGVIRQAKQTMGQGETHDHPSHP